MSEIGDLTAALNNLRQGITDQQHSGVGGEGIAAGATAAVLGGIIDKSNLSVVLNDIARNFFTFTQHLAYGLEGASKAANNFSKVLEQASINAYNTATKWSRIHVGTSDEEKKRKQKSTMWDKVKNNWAVLMEKLPPNQWQSLDIGIKKANMSLSSLTGWITKGSLAIAGMVAVGLRHTVEGYKLTLAFERLAYSMANLLKPVVDLLTGLFNHAAAEINYIHKTLTDPSTSNHFEEPSVNRERDYISRLREIDAAEKEGKQLYDGGVGPFAIKQTYEEARKKAQEEALKKPGFMDFNLLPPFGKPDAMTSEREKQLREGYKGLKSGQGAEEIGGGKRKNQNITPLYQTSFMSLTSLWEQMNKAVTENPGLDVVASWLEKIFNKLPDQNKGGAPQPQGQGAIAP